MDAVFAEMFSPQNVTMRDVAVRAGVTAATVSLALRDSPEISAQTKARVLAAVQELGYRPNPYVQSLMRTRRRGRSAAGAATLALLTAFPTRQGWRADPTPMFTQLFAGASERAESAGFRLEEFWLHEQGMSPKRFAEVLRARGIIGVLVAPLPEPHALGGLPWADFAAVALGFTLLDPLLHRVANDHLHSLLTAHAECRRLGHRRLGLVLTKEVHEKVQRRWLAGYMLAQREDAGEARLEPLLAPELTAEEFQRWFDREWPDVVITASPGRVTTWLKARGLSIPQDVGVVSLSAPEMGGPLSGIYQNFEQIGRRAVDLLVAALERNELGPPALADTLLVDGVWNPGTTVAARG